MRCPRCEDSTLYPDLSAVHVAADVVYTKNGAAPISPWVLMTLDDLRAVYHARRDWEIRGYRLKQGQ